MAYLHIAKWLLIMFGAGVVTSYAEYKFQYSLYLTVTSLFKKKS